MFWELNPKYMYMYQDNYIKEKEEQIKMMDAAAYYQGLYVHQAIASCFSKKAKYPKKPLSMKNNEHKAVYYAAVRAAIGKMNEKFKGAKNDG